MNADDGDLQQPTGTYHHADKAAASPGPNAAPFAAGSGPKRPGRATAPVRVTVGDRNHGGELSGGVTSDWEIWVNAFNGSGVTVKIDAAAAEQFASMLIEWAKHLEVGLPAPRGDRDADD